MPEVPDVEHGPEAAMDRATDVDEPRRSRRRRRLMVVGGLTVVVVAFVLWWFEPQALLFDDVVDEEFPAASTDVQPDTGAPGDDDGTDSGDVEAGSPTTEPDHRDDADVASPAGPVAIASGSFVSRNRYTVTGTATAFQLDDGERVLRLEDFESTNGPDLFVYLTVAGADDDDTALDTEFVDLGALTGNIGNQNYAIPVEVDLTRYDSVVIWCRRFSSSFGVADLAIESAEG